VHSGLSAFRTECLYLLTGYTGMHTTYIDRAHKIHECRIMHPNNKMNKYNKLIEPQVTIVLTTKDWAFNRNFRLNRATAKS